MKRSLIFVSIGAMVLLLAGLQSRMTSGLTSSIGQHNASALQVQINIDTDYYGHAISCHDASDGAVTAHITAGTAPFSYTWSNGAITPTVSNLPSGVFNLTVTDATNTTIETFITIPNPPALDINFNKTLVNCGSTDGQIYLNAVNGTGTYEYSLDSTTWQTDPVFSNLAPGMYHAYARDVHSGCASDAVAIDMVSASAPMIDNITTIHPTMTGNTDGAVLIDASGIGLGIEYRIDGETGWQSVNLFSHLGEGTYTISVRYENQTCHSTQSVELVAGDPITTMDESANVCSDEVSNINNLGVYYLPIAEDEILQALQTITPSSCATRYSVDPIQNYIYLGVVESGTIITYDHWEDGFENNFDFSIQATTEIWGDGDPSNGLPPGYNIDYLEAGDKIFLDDAVVSTTRASIIDFDGGDRVSSRGDISITRLGWASGSSTLFAGAVEVHELKKWGLNYSIPVGENTDVNDMFMYTGFSVMASVDNTTVQIDADGDGNVEQTIVLNQGESHLQNGGTNSGGKISASEPVQVHLITGDDCSRYESRWFTLSPEERWDNGYYMPVSTLNNGSAITGTNNKPSYVHLYNPNTTAIDVTYRTIDGIQGIINIGANETAYQEIPEGTAAYFGADENFYAIATVDSDSGTNTANDWGFALLPERQLSPQIYLTGFAPGQNPEFTCNQGIAISTSSYTATASSAESIAFDGNIQNAFDDDLSTAWYSDYSSGTTHPHEIIIDLGAPQSVSGFRHINAQSNVDTTLYSCSNLPVPIRNNTRFDSTFVIEITDNHAILDLDVILDIEHSKISELTIALESPSGTIVTLFEHGCPTGRDFITTLDDDTAIPFECDQSGAGIAQMAENYLNAFDGEFTQGTWLLHLKDNNGILGGGSFNEWSLSITHGVSAPGKIEDFEFYVSDDGINWGIPLIEGTWIDSIPLHDERMAEIEARYVRLVSLSDLEGVGIASASEFKVLSCGSTFAENSSPLWITAGHAGGFSDTLDVNVCVDFNGDGGSITSPNGATYDSSFMVPPLGLLKLYDPDGDQTGMRVWVCDGSDGVISGAWGQDPATASAADPAIDLGVGLINSIPYSAQKCVQLFNDVIGNNAYDKCDEVTYTIIIKNTGALPLSTGTISIIDTLPWQLEYIAKTSRGVVDGIEIMVEDDTLNSTPFPFDEGGTQIDTIILPGDSLLVRFEALIAHIGFGTFITNQAYAISGENSFDPYISIPIQDPVHPLDSLVPADTLISCETFEYPDPSIDTLSYLSIHDTILEDDCLDAFTFQRIFTFTDNCYQTYTDTMQITVRDTTPPVISIPADTIISMNDMPFVYTIPSSDNCDNYLDITHVDDTTFYECSFVIERVYTATDNCSNATHDTIDITVLQDDESWPVNIAASDANPCTGSMIILQSQINNGDAHTYIPQWYYRHDSSAIWVEINDGDQMGYSFIADSSNTGYYEVRYTRDNASDNLCAEHINQIFIEVKPIPTSGFINESICAGDSLAFNGRMLYQSGQYQDTITNALGCDSIIQIDLSVHDLDHTHIRDTMCFGDTYPFGNVSRDSTGIYFDTLSNVNGCDSIIELALYELPEVGESFSLEICPGEEYDFFGKMVDSTGVFEEVLMSSTGCDSIVTLQLSVRTPLTSLISIPICFGDSTEIGDSFVKSSGMFAETFIDQNGCDSIAEYEVVILDEVVTGNLNQTICEGDSVWFNGIYIHEEGSYAENAFTTGGCDSTTMLHLTVESKIELASEDMIICEGEVAQLHVVGTDEVLWSDPYGLSCVSCPNPRVKPTQTTVYEASIASCNGTRTFTLMTVTVEPNASVSVGADTTIAAGTSLALTATTNDIDAEISWRTVQESLCTNCPMIEVMPIRPTMYIAESHNLLGCVSSDTIIVDAIDGCIEGGLEAPNFITPNGDGNNDLFTVNWSGLKSVDQLKIFNRWGELVFVSNEVDKNFWDGTVQGELVNPGVYVYYIEYYCVQGNLKRLKGNVTVIH